MLLQTLVGLAEDADEAVGSFGDVVGEGEVNGELEDTVEVACGTANAVASKYLIVVAIHQLSQDS